ncbi:MAG: hypothetical protein ABEL04_00840 [Salinibacter sp.]|uniref:hypothetical protein n=1 Tax=Salinibacter sp. TaxID=2065818 RepID=UPI0035D4542E
MPDRRSPIYARFSRRSLYRGALIVPLLGALLVVLAGCSDSDVLAPTPPSLQFEGTVEYQKVGDAKSWVIERPDGRLYLPVRFPAKYKQEGLQVSVEAERAGIEALGEGVYSGVDPEVDLGSAELIQVMEISVTEQ